MIEPIHVGTIRGQQVRFFRSPDDDGRPDFPWVSIDDLAICTGLDRDRRKYIPRMTQNIAFGRKKTVATASGLVTIIEHCFAQGFLGATAEFFGPTFDIRQEYAEVDVEAVRKLTDGFDRAELMSWAVAAVRRNDMPA
jgi:hypothetical protein